jgi:hypothetical protein
MNDVKCTSDAIELKSLLRNYARREYLSGKGGGVLT